MWKIRRALIAIDFVLMLGAYVGLLIGSWKLLTDAGKSPVAFITLAVFVLAAISACLFFSAYNDDAELLREEADDLAAFHEGWKRYTLFMDELIFSNRDRQLGTLLDQIAPLVYQFYYQLPYERMQAKRCLGLFAAFKRSANIVSLSQADKPLQPWQYDNVLKTGQTFAEMLQIEINEYEHRRSRRQ